MAFKQAQTILASSYTTVLERKAAIDIRDEFVSAAPSYVDELLAGLQELVHDAEGEECSDPDSCGSAGVAWRCSRCRLRSLGLE